MSNKDEGAPKGGVAKFKAPEKSPIGKFEKVIDAWLENRQDIVESGSDADFTAAKDKLAEGLVLYAHNLKNVKILANMAAAFEQRRREWAARSSSAAMEEHQEANAAVSLRYAELASVVNRFLPFPGSR